MNVHARIPSQFANRRPNGGPPLPTARQMEAKPPIAGDYFTPHKPRSSSARPIATNSRILREEKYKNDMYLAFVNNALQEKARGKSDSFDELVDQFNPLKLQNDSSFSPGHLRLWLTALSHVVSQVQRVHASLLNAIISFTWTTMDSTFVGSYKSFIGMLVTARPGYLTPVLEKAIQGLTFQAGIQTLDHGGAETSSTPLTRRIVYDRFHELLRHLLDIIPTLAPTLQPILVRFFPHKRQSQICQITYIRNLLQISQYCPALSDRILSTIIDRAMQIDVEIQVELEELDALDAASPLQNIFELDPFDSVVGQDDHDSDADSELGEDALSDISSEGANDEVDQVEETETSALHVHDMVAKLDSILKLLFDHFNHDALTADSPMGCTSDADLTDDSASAMHRDARRQQFHVLLSIFAQAILHTFKSRYTQFLVFWYASLDTEFSDLFQGLLVSKALLEDDLPSVTRAAAASYIASYVSRATFVNKDDTRRVVGVLCEYLEDHLDTKDNYALQRDGSPGSIQDSVFYAIIQAVFLVFCFRWRDLLEEGGDSATSSVSRQWMPQLKVVQRAVNCSLNPLNVCSRNVVLQFARVAKSTGFVYCYSILEANKRTERGVFKPDNLKHGAFDADLNTFFPFDPYRLPRSGHYLEGIYREWTAVAIEDDDDDEEDEGEGSQLSESDQNGLPSVTGVTVREVKSNENEGDGLGLSFGGMSISPAPAPVIGMAKRYELPVT